MSVYDAKALYLLRFMVIWEATTEFTNIYTVRNGFPLIPCYLGRRTNTWEQPCTYVNINSFFFFQSCGCRPMSML